jgi:hypothetical protein
MGAFLLTASTEMPNIVAGAFSAVPADIQAGVTTVVAPLFVTVAGFSIFHFIKRQVRGVIR